MAIATRLSLLVAGLLALCFAATGFADTGGPDEFGYRFIDSNHPGGPDSGFEDISGSGNSIFSNTDDDEVASVPLGFNFDFYGNTYTDITVSTNGNIQFNSSDSTASWSAIPTTGNSIGAAIFPFWTDFDPSSCGVVLVDRRGDPGDFRFIVQWDACHFDVTQDNLACAASVQVILYERTNEILMQYADTTFNTEDCTSEFTLNDGAAVSVGIQRDSDLGLQYTYADPSFNIIGQRPIVAGLAICFYPPGDIIDPVCAPTADLEDPDEICDFAINKSNNLPDPNDILIGSTFTWTLDVSWDADCDDVVFDISDDIPDGFRILSVTPVQGDALELGCNAVNPVVCPDAMTNSGAGTASVEIEVEVTAPVCAAENVAFVAPDDTAATGASDSDTVSSTACGGIIVFKSCPFGAGESSFTVQLEDPAGAVLDSDTIECDGTDSDLGLLAGDYTLRELIDGPDAVEYSTLIRCDGDSVSGTEASVTVPAGVTVACVIINSLGEDVSDLVCLCIGSIEIDNDNTNVIDLDNENTNANGNNNENENDNENTNTNENNNTNTNTQDQKNEQDQDNANEQTSNIDASPEINIEID